MKLKALKVFQRVWESLSRTKPIDTTERARTPRRYIPAKQRWDKQGAKVLLFMYKGLGVSAPLAVFYMIGVLAEEIEGQEIIAALFISVIASIFTGLWYSEFINSDRKCSGYISITMYHLVGEFPSYCVALLHFLALSAKVAICSKAISATMNEMGERKLEAFFEEHLGTLPLSHRPPDILAAAGALLSAVFTACGLRYGGVLKIMMNVLTLVGFLFFMGVGGTSMPDGQHALTYKIHDPPQILVGAAIACCLFSQFLELGRLSKRERRPESILPVGISVTCATIFLGSLPLAILLSVLLKNSATVTGAPLLHALLADPKKKSALFLGIIQICAFSLTIGAAGEEMVKQVMIMASDGFLPSSLTAECPKWFTNARAHLLGGIWVSLLALITPHLFLLQFFASNHLFLAVIIVFCVLYRPYRCHYGSLCTIKARVNCSENESSITATSNLKAEISSSNLPKKQKMQRTVYKLKTGLRFPHPKRIETLDDASDSTIFPASSAAGEERDGNPSASNCIEANNIHDNEVLNQTLETESSSDTDVDAVVIEFKKQLKLSAKNQRILISPSVQTARSALILLTFLHTVFLILWAVIIRLFQNANFSQNGIIIITFLLLICIVILTILSRLPKKSEKTRIPGSPWAPAVIAFLNIGLNKEAFQTVMWATIPIYIIGFVWYATYVRKYSVVAQKSIEKQPHQVNRSRELVCLQPLVPCTNFSAQQPSGFLYTTDSVENHLNSSRISNSRNNIENSSAIRNDNDSSHHI